VDSVPYAIRAAGRDEAQLLAGIIASSFAGVARRFGLTAQNCPKHPSNCTPQWVRGDFERGVVYFLLEADETPVACAALERADARRVYLERLAVLPQMRRRGLGRALVEHVAAQASGLGAQSLGIGIIAAQDELRCWYLKLAFRQGQTKSFAHLPFEVLFMERALQGGPYAIPGPTVA
jgi:GNAT superfamily N-acetyltransferase